MRRKPTDAKLRRLRKRVQDRDWPYEPQFAVLGSSAEHASYDGGGAAHTLGEHLEPALRHAGRPIKRQPGKRRRVRRVAPLRITPVRRTKRLAMAGQ
jgi:hypothetical protein